nr:hypothetical protein CFP56_31515 [Quercus suber]
MERFPDTDACLASDPAEDPVKFVNFQTFAARVCERGLVQGYNLPIWACESAFETSDGNTSEERNAWVKAALQGLLLVGDGIYQEFTEDDRKLDQWSRWHEQVSAVAAVSVQDKNSAYSPDTILLAGRALVTMEAIERLKTG